MKNFKFFVIGFLSMTNFFAQDLQDALRYSMDDIAGSARFSAMSGAFGALGGDLSAVSINPAGAAIFNRSYASFSLNGYNIENDVRYLNGFNSMDESEIDLHQFGAAYVFKNTDTGSAWKKLVLGVTYDQNKNFDDAWFASGTNTQSIDQYFLAFAQGKRLENISAFDDENLADAYADIGANSGYDFQQAFLGYESFILDPEMDSGDNTRYVSNLSQGDFQQDYTYLARGYNGKFSFNAATQYGDKLHIGINLNAHFVNYERSTLLLESNDNTDSLVKEIEFQNNLSTSGSGFSFQLGAIYKFTEQLRGGFSYNSPTWFTIYEETSQFLSTRVDEIESDFFQVIDPQTINVFPSYRLQTPSKYTGSLAYIFGEKGLISFDYSLKDFSNIQLRPTNDLLFSNLNNNIAENLDTSASYKIGAEYRYKAWSFRGGYRFEESPYKDQNIYGDLMGYSFGLGYNLGNAKIDLAFSDAKRDYNSKLYQVGLTDSASLKSEYKTLSLTLGFSLW